MRADSSNWGNEDAFPEISGDGGNEINEPTATPKCGNRKTSCEKRQIRERCAEGGAAIAQVRKKGERGSVDGFPGAARANTRE